MTAHARPSQVAHRPQGRMDSCGVTVTPAWTWLGHGCPSGEATFPSAHSAKVRRFGANTIALTFPQTTYIVEAPVAKGIVSM